KKDSFIYEDINGSNDAITVKFEDIFNEPYDGLENIIEFMEFSDGINLNTESVKQKLNRPENESKTYEIPHWSEWDNHRLKTFNRIAGEHMELYGYD
ncbi:MAG: hypothetical protein ABEJ65_12630, partial [bacterium]